MLGTPPYCRPMIRLRKSSFWVMLKACWRMRTKSGLKDLEMQERRDQFWPTVHVDESGWASVGGSSSIKTSKILCRFLIYMLLCVLLCLTWPPWCHFWALACSHCRLRWREQRRWSRWIQPKFTKAVSHISDDRGFNAFRFKTRAWNGNDRLLETYLFHFDVIIPVDLLSSEQFSPGRKNISVLTKQQK